MSTKKPANQKPVPQNPDAQKAEAGDEATPTLEQAITGEAGTGQEHVDAPEQPPADQTDDAPDQATADPADTVTAQPEDPASEAPAVIVTVAEALAITADGLATRLTKAVNSIQTSGKPDMVHALHKVELIVGSLKTALPAAIETIDGLSDESLKADLQTLLALL